MGFRVWGYKEFTSFVPAGWKISYLELSVADPGMYRIWYFSLIQRLHFSFTGLKVWMLVFKNFHEIFGSCPASFWVKKWEESVVLLEEEGFSILVLCLLNLCLKSFAKPTYVWMFLPPSEVTVVVDKRHSLTRGTEEPAPRHKCLGATSF